MPPLSNPPIPGASTGWIMVRKKKKSSPTIPLLHLVSFPLLFGFSLLHYSYLPDRSYLVDVHQFFLC